MTESFYNLLRGKHPIISKDEAIKIAKQECDRRGWGWLEPVEIKQGRKAWKIRTNAFSRGTIAIFSIDHQTGAVLRAGYIPR
jgi:hypothetical protein